MNKSKGGRPARHVSSAGREAMSAFLAQGLWGDEKRKAFFAAALSSCWDEFKSEPYYETLKSDLSAAMKGNGKHGQ